MMKKNNRLYILKIVLWYLVILIGFGSIEFILLLMSWLFESFIPIIIGIVILIAFIKLIVAKVKAKQEEEKHKKIIR